MTTIGNDEIPGVQTTVDTSDTVGISADSPTDPCLVGPADLTNGNASANEVVTVTTPSDAVNAFGPEESSFLTEQVYDALQEGARPIFAVATAETAVTGEDISGISSTSGDLSNAPVTENPDDTVFTVDGSTKNTVITYGDPSTETVGTGDVHLNPESGTFELDAAPSSSGTVDYTHLDYAAANDAAADQRGETIDFLAPLQANQAAADDALATVNSMESYYDFAVALVPLPMEAVVQDDMTTDVTWDDSRIQAVYPSRDADGSSVMGAYAGRRASLGLTASAMAKSLTSKGRLYERISVQQQKDLVNNNVVPLRSSSNGAVIVDDPTVVTDSNSEEAGMRQGFARLVMDSVIELVNANEQPFIGRLNTAESRNALRNVLDSELDNLLNSDAIEEYQVTVTEKDAMSVDVNVTVDTTDPLRNIYNTISAGRVA